MNPCQVPLHILYCWTRGLFGDLFLSMYWWPVSSSAISSTVTAPCNDYLGLWGMTVTLLVDSSTYFSQKQKYQSYANWTGAELSASDLKKRSKAHKMLKRTPFNWTKQDKMCKFLRKSFFFFFFSKLFTTQKQTIHLFFARWMPVEEFVLFLCCTWLWKKGIFLKIHAFCLVLFN